MNSYFVIFTIIDAKCETEARDKDEGVRHRESAVWQDDPHKQAHPELVGSRAHRRVRGVHILS